MAYAKSILPLLAGLALALLVALAAFALEWFEARLWGHVWLEALVLAILLGAILRSMALVPQKCCTGLRFAAKPVMEGAVALMGASVSLAALSSIGMAMIAAIVLAITLTIALGYRIGRWLGLSRNMALLVACGNAICGNSAIAAVGPAIGADAQDVATSIGYTAVMGVAVVVAVPFIAVALGIGPFAGGVLAGMTVYAVPQVLAAAHPLGSLAVQVGALVKLVRVLMLGPVVASLSLMRGNKAPASLGRFLPPFVAAFLSLVTLRSLGLIPDALAGLAHTASLWLTVVAMAGLGLGVDLRSVAGAGPRVTASVVCSLAVLFGGAFVMSGPWGLQLLPAVPLLR